MNPKDFDELIESVREAGRILRGEAKSSRQEDVQAIRQKLKSLAEQITDENRHDEIETGTRVGDEVW